MKKTNGEKMRSNPLWGDVAKPSTSHQRASAEAVNRLFEVLTYRYGTRFLDQWAGLDLERVRNEWADELAGTSEAELIAAVRSRRCNPWPPTLAEIRALCMPQINPEAALQEAAAQLYHRRSGRDRWSHPAIYWAAVRVGDFAIMNLTWAQIKTRWESALADELEKRQWPQVPVNMDALPRPGRLTTRADVARERLAAMTRAINGA